MGRAIASRHASIAQYRYGDHADVLWALPDVAGAKIDIRSPIGQI